MKVRTLIKSRVSWAIIHTEDVIMGSDQGCSASKKLGSEVLVVPTKEVNRCFRSVSGINSKLRQMVTRGRTTTLKSGIARILAGEILPVNSKVECHRQLLQQIFNHYQINKLLSVLEGLSFNFDF